MSATVERGHTFYGPTQTIDTDDYAGINAEGTVTYFADTDISDPDKIVSSRKTKAVLMRNVSGGTLYAKYAVVPASGYDGRRFTDTYTKACRAAGIIDDRLVSTGCRNGDMCWVMVEGPASYYTPTSSPTTSIGDLLYIKNDDDGKLAPHGLALTFTTTEQGDGMGSILFNSLGRAMEAATSGDTSTSKKIMLDVRA